MHSQFQHLFHNDADIAGRILYMVARALVTAFHHFRQGNDKAVLKSGYLFALLFNIVCIGDNLACGIQNGFIQVFNFISGGNIQFLESVQCLLL